jgi:hypothetical protein
MFSNNLDYEKKYLKYKIKYLELKQDGGLRLSKLIPQSNKVKNLGILEIKEKIDNNIKSIDNELKDKNKKILDIITKSKNIITDDDFNKMTSLLSERETNLVNLLKLDLSVYKDNIDNHIEIYYNSSELASQILLSIFDRYKKQKSLKTYSKVDLAKVFTNTPTAIGKDTKNLYIMDNKKNITRSNINNILDQLYDPEEKQKIIDQIKEIHDSLTQFQEKNIQEINLIITTLNNNIIDNPKEIKIMDLKLNNDNIDLDNNSITELKNIINKLKTTFKIDNKIVQSLENKLNKNIKTLKKNLK